MPRLSPGAPAVSSPLAAGLLLASIPLLESLHLPHPTASQAIEATGAGRSRAYQYKAAIEQVLPDLVRPPGRPPAPPPTPPPAEATTSITADVLAYVMGHPGCVHGTEQRRRYGDGFRLFVLDLWAQHVGVDLVAFADASQIPLGTLKDWIRGGRDEVDNVEPVNLASIPADRARGPRIEAILEAYAAWRGSFVDFCGHVQFHLHIPWGRTTIGKVLELHGVRLRKRRPGRTPDEKATRDAFETFFPGAMWSADGTPLAVTINGQTFAYNLELNVDTHTTAIVGMSLRDTEDGAAVAEAFADGVATAGDPPIAQLLDNRFSNHTGEVTDALGDTIKIRRTLGRPQNGAHVEGAFGLFQQRVPSIALDTSDDRELGRSVLGLVVQAWARTLNHKPRTDKDERSRVQRYTEDIPTDEEIAAAQAALTELQRKQDQARQTRQARLDPVRRVFLDQAFEDLGLPDPGGHIRDAIAVFQPDSIVAGVAVFKGMQKHGSLPEGVDGRYLLGIVKRIDREDEGVAIAEALWQARRDAGDIVLQRLDGQRDRLEEDVAEPMDLVRRFVDLAMGTDRYLDRSFWLRAVADTIEVEPAEEHRAMFLVAARRIHATHRVPRKQRHAAARRLAAMVRPIV